MLILYVIKTSFKKNVLRMRRKAVSAEKCSVPILWMLFSHEYTTASALFPPDPWFLHKLSIDVQSFVRSEIFLWGQNRLKSRTCCGKWQPMAVVTSTVIRTGPDIKLVRLSVHWFTGPTVRNRLNRRFNCFGPDELDRPQILWTGTT